MILQVVVANADRLTSTAPYEEGYRSNRGNSISRWLLREPEYRLKKTSERITGLWFCWSIKWRPTRVTFQVPFPTDAP